MNLEITEEYVVQIGRYHSRDGFWPRNAWKDKFRYRNQEDAQWMMRYQQIIKRRNARVIRVVINKSM